MAIETATTINQLVAANPPNSDQVAEAAAHLRLLKAVIQATFPNITGPVTVTQEELNYSMGLTSKIVDQLYAEIVARQNADALKADKTGATFTGPVILPAQGANPAEAARKDYADGLVFSSSLPGQAGNAGKLVTTDGSAASWTAIKTVSGQALLGTGDIVPVIQYSAVTGATQTAVSGGAYSLQNAAASTVTLPVSPAANAFVAVKVSNGLATNVIARNGQTIEGLVENLTLDSASASVGLQFLNNSWRRVFS